MTVEKLQNLFKELQKLKKKQQEIYSNDDLSRNQMNAEFEKIAPRMQKIENILGNYSNVFKVEANTLTLKILSVLSKKLPFTSISSDHICKGKEVEKEYFEGYETCFEGTAYIQVHLYDQKTGNYFFRLFVRQVCDNLELDYSYIFGHYKVDLVELLNETNICKYTAEIHKACWLAIAETVANKNKERVKENKKTQTLIQRKIKELQNKSKAIESENANLIDNKEIIFSDTVFKERIKLD